MSSAFPANMQQQQQQQQQQQPLYHTAPLSLDTKHNQGRFDDDDNVLDDNILDNSAVDSGLELSPPMVDSRRESFALGGPPLFSPKTEDWQSVDMQSVPSNNPFFQQSASNNPFMHLDQNHTATFGTHGHGWNMDHINGLSPQFDPNASVFRAMAQTPFGPHPGNMFANIATGNHTAVHAPALKDPMRSGQVMDDQSMGKKTRPPTPVIRSHRDGIRKKNARFDIPSEYTLANIDEKIENEKDPDKKKLLKSHKRLLRNRQAALDSRQRKKQHTERLEDEKKQFTSVITDMEEEMNALKIRMEQLFREKQEYAECISRLNAERDELIIAHTNESGELRKKIAVLSDHVRRLDPDPAATGTTATANTNGFSGFYGEMEDLAMGGPWEHSSFMNDYPAEPEVKQEMAVIPVKKTDVGGPVEGDKASPQQGGLLFMLFLVGAFVLSNRSTPAIPRVSEDVRAASATLLDNVLKDAGVSGGHPTSSMQPMAPQPSGTWAEHSVMQGSNMNMDTVAPSMLEELGNSLTQPTQEQTNKQLFSLSEAQYHGVHNQDFIHNSAPERFSSTGRRNLAEALATLRVTGKQDGAAEVYTRSLLWDQIPREVVRNFAKMVSESNNAQNEQQCNDATS